MQTIVDLNDEQLAALRDLCTSDAISETARDAIAAVVQANSTNGAAADPLPLVLVDDLSDQDDSTKKAARQAANAAMFGMWKGRGIDSIEYVRTLRAEWDRD